jgi:alpha-L-glutamate ligase-like protein
VVIGGRTEEGGYIKSSGAVLSPGALQYHVSNILNGLFSLGGVTDKAIIEYRVHIAPLFQNIAYQGVPDIRLIVYHGVPVMAMLRVPTKQSDGKANLHAGGIGIGISIQTGRTTGGIWRGQFIDVHHDTGARLEGIAIPDWRKMLELAARFDGMLGLGYIGVDLVIDEHLGPMLLEVNARPGLAIQVANRTGIKPRLRLVDEHLPRLNGLDSKIAFAQERFS